MIKKMLWIPLCCFIGLGGLMAQEDVFPQLYGAAAQLAVKNAYTPTTVMSYAQARDTLFRRVIGKNDSLSCVYSGHRVYMDPAEDPTTTVFQNGGTNGINTEHTWPQAYGAGSGPARSNMHHLFPTRILVNAARANFPFAEISDSETQAWYYLNQVQSNIPSSNIERYSEYQQGSFEPREDFKGDIARAMFYFQTIYSEEAQTAPADFFSSQISTLYQWHLQDPADAAERLRSAKIATYQSDKANPFILDSTLVARVYCEALGLLCTPSAIKDPAALGFDFAPPYPNPFGAQIAFEYTLPQSGQVTLTIYDARGQKIEVLVNRWQSTGDYRYQWSETKVNDLGMGLFFAQLHWQKAGEEVILWQKMIRSK